MRDQDNDDRPRSTMQAEVMMPSHRAARDPSGISDGRKHELFMLAEHIVGQVRAANARGPERCFLNDLVQLLLRD